MVDFIVIIVLLVLLSAAVCYLVKAKNKGQACVGCPNASSCNKYGQCKGNGE